MIYFVFRWISTTSCMVILNMFATGNMQTDALLLKQGAPINGNLHTSLPPSSTTEDDRSYSPPWLKLPANTGDFCPRKDVCIWNGTNTHDLVKDHCCTACSCDETCAVNRSCCFPHLNTDPPIGRSLQSCLPLRYPFSDIILKNLVLTYYIVELNPEDGYGCRDMETTTLLGDKQCGEVSAAAWGSFNPVQSPHTRQIYKNIHCAKCHGVIDPVFAEPQLHCKYPETIFNLMPSVLKMMAFYKCFMTFKLHLPNYRDRCDAKFVDSCDPFVIPTVPKGVALTSHEIHSACTSDFVSPYTLGHNGYLYANIFCAMCNSKQFDISRTCPESDGGGRSPGESFSIILTGTNDNYFETSTEQKQACFLQTGQQCRPVYCAVGMVPKAGKCVRLDTEMDGYSFAVMLKLVPDRIINSDTKVFQNQVLYKDGRKLVFKKRPWSDNWKIVELYLKLSNTTNSSMYKIPEMIVKLEYKTTSVNPAVFFKEVAKNLDNKTWTISINKDVHVLRQSIAEFTKLGGIKLGEDVFSGQPVFTIPGLKNLTNDKVTSKVLQYVSYGEINLLETEIKHLEFTFYTYITETLFCDQIELYSDEYVLYSDSNLLYHNILDKYLYNGQFSLSVNSSGIAVVKTCLDNVGFVVPSSASNRLYLNYIAVLQLVFLGI